VRTVAVIDIGKSNAKVALLSAEEGCELSLRIATNAVRPDGPYPHFDIPEIWHFICDSLADLNRAQPIECIVVTTHGGAAALISGDADRDGLALPVIDYEFDGPDELSAAYDAVRPPFSETFSPRLPAGLNLGAQLFWQERRFPHQFAAAQALVTYPQYWAWRLSGVAAAEATSLGSHTDLWRPAEGRISSLTQRMGWSALLAPIRSPFDRLGPLRPGLARRLGLAHDAVILCGIHDSNASLLPHLTSLEAPFTVISTGTWVIVLAVGGDIAGLDPTRDALAYVNAFGAPVPAARFMGGREYEHLAGAAPVTPSPAEIDHVIGAGVMALPGFVPGTGPFPRRTGGWSHDAATLSPGERAAAASLYLALVSEASLGISGARGPVIIEGPFGQNQLFCSALAAVMDRPLFRSGRRTGTTEGALLLASGRERRTPAAPVPVAALPHPSFPAYAAQWRRLAAQPG
jgi:sugar (pentulose or hexulose) kinase